MWGEMHQTPNHPSCCTGAGCVVALFAGLMGHCVSQEDLSSRTVSTAGLGGVHTPDSVPKSEMSLYAGAQGQLSPALPARRDLSHTATTTTVFATPL